jgi:hypothetical protein
MTLYNSTNWQNFYWKWKGDKTSANKYIIAQNNHLKNNKNTVLSKHLFIHFTIGQKSQSFSQPCGTRSRQSVANQNTIDPQKIGGNAINFPLDRLYFDESIISPLYLPFSYSFFQSKQKFLSFHRAVSWVDGHGTNQHYDDTFLCSFFIHTITSISMHEPFIYFLVPHYWLRLIW